MTRKPVHIAFEKAECILPLASIIPQRVITAEHRRTTKYKQIASTIESVGIIEALVVFPRKVNEYLLLDGHFRYDILKARGVLEVRCTFSTDDEAYTYNRR